MAIFCLITKYCSIVCVLKDLLQCAMGTYNKTWKNAPAKQSSLYHSTATANTQWLNYINYVTNCFNETKKAARTCSFHVEHCFLSGRHESCLSHWSNFTMGPLKKQSRSVQFGLEIVIGWNQPQKPVSWLRELNWSLYGLNKQTIPFTCEGWHCTHKPVFSFQCKLLTLFILLSVLVKCHRSCMS